MVRRTPPPHTHTQEGREQISRLDGEKDSAFQGGTVYINPRPVT